MSEPSTGLDGRAPPGVVGPNAVIQLAQALNDGPGADVARRIFAAAGCDSLLEEPPSEMIDERIPARLFETLWEMLSAATARRVAEEAGRRTGRYILKHRIPGFAQKLLRILPPWAAMRLLTHAIARHAWTFAGSGVCRTRPGNPAIIEIIDNPIPMPGCVWHQAVFGALFGDLIAGDVQVNLVQGCSKGAATCRFELAHAPVRVRTADVQPTPAARPSGDRV